ncbi:MAG TPA: endonuclease/exonuclease/phosphatase family protein [Phycisphaerae bacterium]|nr:endonuclease/exonuclease/phosphatase family protein [Phycisphaerae bacterium]
MSGKFGFKEMLLSAAVYGLLFSGGRAQAGAVTGWTIDAGGGTVSSGAGAFSLTNATGATAVQGNFSPTSLNAVGDSITLSATLNQTITQGNVQFRFGLYDANGNSGNTNWLGYWVGDSASSATQVLFRRSGTNGNGFWSGSNGGAYLNGSAVTTPSVMPAGTYALSLTVTRQSDTQLRLNYSMQQNGGGYTMTGSYVDNTPQQLAAFQYNQAGFLLSGGGFSGNVALSNVSVTSTAAQVLPPPTAASLKVMTYNVQNDGGGGLADEFDTRGWNSIVATPRRVAAVAMIQSVSPDLFGVQEAYNDQMTNLKSDLGIYNYVGVGRNDGSTAGEYAAIFYKASRFGVVNSGTFWLSSTPTVPGTTFSTMSGATPREATWAKLTDNQTGRTYFVLDTHLDNQDATARQEEADLIRSEIKALAGNLPVIVTGDFNSVSTDYPATTVEGVSDSSGPYLIDSYNRDNVTSGYGTYDPNLDGALYDGARMDYVLNSPDFQAASSVIINSTFDGIYPSDHYPVVTTFNVAVAPEPASIGVAAVGMVVLGVRRGGRRRD